MTINDKSSQKVAIKNYTCNICDYNTCKYSNYKKHLLTSKHQRMTDDDKKAAKSSHTKFECTCGNIYKFRQGLFNHKKKCDYESSKINENPEFNASMVMEIIKENQEFKTLLLEQYKHSELQQKKMFELQEENKTIMNKMVEITQQITIPSSITHNTTNHNNQFNLNIFLNETCKNAINFTDFIDNIHVTENDLENNVKMGFVDGITKIIIDNLKQLELYNRPIHCTDIKRETIYVKEEDQWEKDNSKEVIQKGIQEITCKNMLQLTEWRENNPEYNDLETDIAEKSIAMQQSSMAGGKREEFYPKIIKNIAKETIIDKNSNMIKVV